MRVLLNGSFSLAGDLSIWYLSQTKPFLDWDITDEGYCLWLWHFQISWVPFTWRFNEKRRKAPSDFPSLCSALDEKAEGPTRGGMGDVREGDGSTHVSGVKA
jgi:hypothetical protein